jgi:hypothetical protein
VPDDLRDRVLSLTNSDLAQNDRLDELEARLDHLDKLLEGDPEDKHDNGLKGDLKDLDRGLNSLRAIMAPDSLGHGGIINRLKALESGERTSESRWKFKTAVVVAFIGTLTAIVTNLDRIEKFFQPKPAVIQPVKRRPVKRVIRKAPPPPPVTAPELELHD